MVRPKLFGKVSDRVQSRLSSAHYFIICLSALRTLRQSHAQRQPGSQLSPRQPVGLHKQQRQELASARLLLGLALLSAGGRGGQDDGGQPDWHDWRSFALVPWNEFLEFCGDHVFSCQVHARLDWRQDDKSTKGEQDSQPVNRVV